MKHKIKEMKQREKKSIELWRSGEREKTPLYYGVAESMNIGKCVEKKR